MANNYKITLEYDGSNYSGWQKQKNTKATIQEKLENALSKVNKSKVAVIGSGRTDAGVHAAGQTANFFLDIEIPTYKIPIAINTHLPDDIICYKAEKVAIDFHARYDARGKKYRYRILNSNFNSVFVRNFVYKVHQRLDVDLMRKGAEVFLGTHDFAAFCSAGSSVDSTIREIYSLAINVKPNGEIQIDISGNGFLYNMVRILVGTLIELAKGKRNPADLKEILAGCQRRKAGFTAPAKGLTLLEVFYD